MAKGWKIAAGLAAVAAAAGAVFAIKKRKDMENYDYEELDEELDDCDCCCDECADEACEAEKAVADEAEATDDVEADLDKVEEPVEETDK